MTQSDLIISIDLVTHQLVDSLNTAIVAFTALKAELERLQATCQHEVSNGVCEICGKELV